MELTVSDEPRFEAEAVENSAAALPAKVAERVVWHSPVLTVINLTRTMAAPGGYLEDGGLLP